MKSGLNSLGDLVEEIKRRAQAKEDLVVSTNNLQAIVEGDEVRLLVKGRDAKPINGVAHRQIQGHLKIPADYYDRMLAEQPELLCSNINAWLWANRENRLVRRLFDTTRAFLSDAFRPLENEDLAAAVAKPLIDVDADVMSAQITDTKLYIKAVDKKVTRELAKIGAKFGDGKHKIVRGLCCPAITISNSEVGHGALSVLGGVYQDWCSNLSSFKERSTRKYHAGARHQLMEEETYALLSDRTRAVTDQALWMQVGDIVRAAFDRARFDSLCEKIEATQNDTIEGDVVKAVTFAAKRFTWNEEETQAIQSELIQSGELTRFGLYNAVTRVSADLSDYDRATEFERIGGQIVELPQDEWRQIAA